MAIFRKQNAYWIDYRVNRKRLREKIGPSYKLAQEVLHKRKAEIAERKFFPERNRPSIPFKDFGAKYWNLHGQHLKSANAKHLHDKLVAYFGSYKLEEVTIPLLVEFYNRKFEETSASTANRYRDHLMSMFNRAREWGDFFLENPVSKVKRKREENHRLRFLSKEEMAALLDKCDKRIYPVLLCALMTGMRKAELLGLRWENIDLEHNVIYILKSKSGKRREIPIAPKLRDQFFRIGPRPEGSVFGVPDITLRRYFSVALKDAKISGFRFHDLRHTFASHFLMRTSDLPALQGILGHYSPILTQRYAHLAKGHLVAEMQIFDSAIPVSKTDGHLDGHQGNLAETPEPSKIAVNQ